MERAVDPTLTELAERMRAEIEMLLALIDEGMPEPIRRQRQLAAIGRVDRMCADFMAVQKLATRRRGAQTVVH